MNTRIDAELWLCNGQSHIAREFWPSFGSKFFITNADLPHLHPPVRILRAQFGLSSANFKPFLPSLEDAIRRRLHAVVGYFHLPTTLPMMFVLGTAP